MCGLTLDPSLLPALWSVGKTVGYYLSPTRPQLVGYASNGKYSGCLTPPLSLIFLHVLSVSCFLYQLLVPSYNAISSKAATLSRKKCHNELINQIFLNLFTYCVQYLLQLPHKLLHHHFTIWHQAAKAVLIVLLLKVWEWFLLLLTFWIHMIIRKICCIFQNALFNVYNYVC